MAVDRRRPPRPAPRAACCGDAGRRRSSRPSISMPERARGRRRRHRGARRSPTTERCSAASTRSRRRADRSIIWRWRGAFLDARRARAGREADGGVAGRGRRDDSRGRRRPARCWPSATPSASIRPSQAALAGARAAAVHRGAPAERLSRAQPRHRRHLRRDDSRPRYHAGHGSIGAWSAVEAIGVPVLTPQDRHRQRAREVRVGLHRQHHGQPHQPRQGPQGAVFPAGHVRVGGLRRAGAARSGALRPRAGRAAGDRRRAGRGREGRAAAASSWRTSSTPIRDGRAPARRPGADGRRALALATRVAAGHRRGSLRTRSHVSRHQRLHRRARSPQGAGAHRRAGQSRPRDRRGHRSRLQVAGRRSRAAVRAADRRLDAGRRESVRIDVAHLSRARRRDARRPRDTRSKS